MERIDFHSHCLPGMDDGAATTAEALRLLHQTVKQGVRTVVATPHFYWGEETVETFLERRQAAFQTLQEAIAKDSLLAGQIRILPGAEVLLREGISRQPLQALCLAGTDYLMLELPFSPPPEWLYEEIENIVFDQKLRVVFAHVDRYIAWYSRDKIAELLELPEAAMQLNGDALQHRRMIRALYRWLPETDAVLFGSDMHHPDTRPQTLGAAMRCLKHCREGRFWLDASVAFSKQLLHTQSQSALL